MARIEIYGNDSNVTLDDKVIGTDALDNSTKNFTVGDIVNLASGGGTGIPYTAGVGIDITNNVISSTIVDTDTNKYVDAISLVGTDLDFDFNDNSAQSVSLAPIADKTVLLTGAGGIAVTGTYPSFIIDGSNIAGTQYTAGTGINITNNVISSTVADTNTTYNFGAVGIQGTGAISIALSGSDATNDVVQIQSGANITLTDNGSSVFTIAAANTTYGFGLQTFLGGGQLGLIGTDGSQQSIRILPGNGITMTVAQGDLTISSAATVASPETLILKVSNTDPIGISSAPGTELTFAATGASVKTNSVHINAADLALVNANDIVVSGDCTVKLSLGAYIDNSGQSGQITFQVYKISSGILTLVGEASFDLSNQAVTVIPTTFFSFFDFAQGEIYKFTAYSAQHAMTIVPGSFIQIEVLK